MAETSALIIGGGGREHALGMAVSQEVDRVFFSPGNGGTELLENGVNLPPIDEVAFAKANNVALTIIGPEQSLVNGLADRFRAEHLSVFGPDAAAARLEASKVFAHGFMGRHGIPQPKTRILSDPNRIDEYTDGINTLDVVLKADGLAGGKGVVLPETHAEMKEMLYGMLSGQLFGGAGKGAVLMQERLSGPEVSVFVLTDGTNFSILPYAQDHKRLKNNDEGPNTGGMGAFAPVPSQLFTPRQHDKIHEIAARSITGMREDGNPYRGVLYIGIMLAEEYDNDPVVIEYNARFGDPEAQVILPLMSLAGLNTYELLKSTDNRLDTGHFETAKFAGHAALTVCLAAEGYPVSPKLGAEIYGLERDYKNVIIYHGGTKRLAGKTVVAGGRVLSITGLGTNIDKAAEAAYPAIDEEQGVHFDGNQYRDDIGWFVRSRK